jgi:hypothetical protein
MGGRGGRTRQDFVEVESGRERGEGERNVRARKEMGMTIKYAPLNKPNCYDLSYTQYLFTNRCYP